MLSRTTSEMAFSIWDFSGIDLITGFRPHPPSMNRSSAEAEAGLLWEVLKLNAYWVGRVEVALSIIPDSPSRKTIEVSIGPRSSNVALYRIVA